MSLIFPIFQSPTKKLLKYYYVLSIIFFFPKPCNSISRYFFVLSIKTFRVQITSLIIELLKLKKKITSKPFEDKFFQPTT